MNSKSLLIPKFLNLLLLLGNIILIFLINSNFNSKISKTFTIFLIFIILLMLLYVPKVTLKNVEGTKDIYIKTALKKFCLFFISTIIFYYTVDFIFDRFTVMQIFIKCFIISFTLSFMDITFAKQQKNKE